MNTIHTPRYIQIIDALRNIREQRRITQVKLAKRLKQHQSYVAKVEVFERRLDIIELMDWLACLDYEPLQFFQDIGWFSSDGNTIPLPIKGQVKEHDDGVLQQLIWQGQIKEVLLTGIKVNDYLRVEEKVSKLFASLNLPKSKRKNREVITDALEYAICELPNLNPSDIYQHVIYRLYIREYNRSKPEQSWARSGGEALELFIERHYSSVLSSHNITIKALISREEKTKAVEEMELTGQIGKSKLDIVLYGNVGKKRVIFGAIHSKASLAERVSDDVPCSRAMMKKGFTSILYTFDSKSFPPPQGDLINRGELGSNNQSSDKRIYIEEDGDFDACFSYNTRTNPSNKITPSGKKIYASSLKRDEDPLPNFLVQCWNNYAKKPT
ncbi:BsaWI family type II restriction enzyme [Anaerolineales bacterium HSG6]|nr:BsaWI family type II restriction enzyme [Anaerolineales bacterium HSG6]